MTATWAQLTAMLDAQGLVAVTDAVLGRTCPDEGEVTLDHLARAMRPGLRGYRNAMTALELADGGAASAPETTLRLLVLSWGAPAPEVGGRILDENGGWIAQGYLVWREQRVVVEYEGDHHRTDRRQWHHDIARVRALEAAGWKVIRATARDLRRPAALREALLGALQG
ncbi:DUF559 domain-containing protein [Kytococcus sp. Marseille-QA3725]